jgi:Transglutaminase-like superfamily
MVWFRSAASNYGKFQQLSWQERWWLLQALVLVPFTGVALRLLGFERCHSLLARLATPRRTPLADAARLLPTARAMGRMVRIAAARGLHKASCLPQSLALWYLLRRQGMNSQLRIGVRKAAGRLEAHAWAELAGSPIEPDDAGQRFEPFDHSWPGLRPSLLARRQPRSA